MHQRIEMDLPDELIAALKARARSQRVTLVTLLSCAWALVLRRYSGQDDVVFGQTNAGRPASIAGIDRAVGAFINTLPARAKIDPDMSVTAFLAAGEADAIRRRGHEHAALADVLAQSALPRGEQVFETLFVFEDFPAATGNAPSISVENIAWANSSTYPLTLLVLPQDVWRMEAIHDPARLTTAMVRAILADFEALLRCIGAGQGGTVGELTQAAWSRAGDVAEPPVGPLVCGAILERAWQTPDALAVGSMSYGALDAASAALAARLQAAGIGRGDIVPIAVPRSGDVVVAMLAILRTGAAYAPLDLDYPPDRLAQMIAVISPRVIVTGGAAILPATDAMLIPVDAAGDAPFRPVAIAPDDPAYVIFTSGSQGAPKGVEISHGALAYSTHARAGVYPDAPGVFLLLSSFAFDSSVVGIYWTLVNGGRLIVSEPRAEQDMTGLGRVMQGAGVTHMLCLPALYATILEAVPKGALAALKTVIVAGEAVAATLARTHRAHLPHARLFNEYGPTEATVWCAAADITAHEGAGPVPIGAPPPGTEMIVADPDGLPVPDGVVGEMWVTGPGLALGYCNASDAAFPVRAGRRYYRTGDLGYRLESGELAYLGRRDNQVKIRGHRVELAEVEAALCTHAAGGNVAVIATGAPLRLVAFVTGDADPEAMRVAMAAAMPVYMIPSAFHRLGSLPRLPNGKIDTGELARHAVSGPQEAQAIRMPPETYTERRLAEIWAGILGVDDIWRDDNFFDRGGDSLRTIAVMLKAEQAGLNVAPYELFDYPVLKDLAAQIHARAEARTGEKPVANLAHANREGRKPLFFMIHGSPRMYAYLGTALGEDRPLGFLFSHFMGGRISLRDRVEDLAAEAMARLKSLQPEGPYYLGGYSLGGVIAFELAQRLRAEGEVVKTLFLLDPSYNVYHPDLPRREGRRETRNRVLEKAKGRLLMPYFQVKGVLRKAERERARLSFVGNAYRRILTFYRPEVYDGRTVVLQTPGARRPGASWLDYALSEAVFVDLPFDHLGLQRDPDALMAWTAKLSEILNEEGG